MNQTLLSVEIGQSHRRDLEDRAAAHRAVRAVRTAVAVPTGQRSVRSRGVRARVSRWARALAPA